MSNARSVAAKIEFSWIRFYIHVVSIPHDVSHVKSEIDKIAILSLGLRKGYFI